MMMKHLLSIAFLFSFHLIFSQAKFELKLDLKIGDKYFIETKINSVTTQEVMGEVQIIKKDDYFSYDYEVIDKPTKNTYYIKLAYTRFITSIVLENEVNTIDSDSTYKQDQPLSKLYNFLINKNIFISITNKGNVQKIDSLEIIYKKFNTFQDLSDEEYKLFKDLFGVQNITNLSRLSIFPENKVKENETWIYDDSIKSGILKIINSTFSINKVEPNSYTIKKTSKLTTDKNKTLSINKIFLNYDLSGDLIGEDVIDKETCMIIHSKSVHEASGTVSMKYTKNSDPAYTWPIIIKNSITVKATKSIEK